MTGTRSCTATPLVRNLHGWVQGFVLRSTRPKKSSATGAAGFPPPRVANSARLSRNSPTGAGLSDNTKAVQPTTLHA